jgi:hypothetical protein
MPGRDRRRGDREGPALLDVVTAPLSDIVEGERGPHACTAIRRAITAQRSSTDVGVA